MKKALFMLIGAGALLSACVKPPVAAPLTEAQLQSMSCKQIGRETDKLNLRVNQLRGNSAIFGPDERDTQAAISAAEFRLQQLRTQSVKKLCVFG